MYLHLASVTKKIYTKEYTNINISVAFFRIPGFLIIYNNDIQCIYWALGADRGFVPNSPPTNYKNKVL